MSGLSTPGYRIEQIEVASDESLLVASETTDYGIRGRDLIIEKDFMPGSVHVSIYGYGIKENCVPHLWGIVIVRCMLWMRQVPVRFSELSTRRITYSERHIKLRTFLW